MKIFDLYEREALPIIAVDFDGTLCRDEYPEIGEANAVLIRYLKNQKRKGARLILWTCRNGRLLEQAVEWCRRHRLEFDAVNENLPEILKRYGGDSRKIYADVYIDDKSVAVKYEGFGLRKIAGGYTEAEQILRY